MTARPADGARSPEPAPIHALLGLSATTDRRHWQIGVHDGVLTRSGALHGGSAFGAAVEAIVATTGRPAVWATAQFVAHAVAGSTLDVWVEEVATGHLVTQARARIEHDGEEVLTTIGAFGSRSFDVEHTWVEPLDVPRPDECVARATGGEQLIGLWQSRVAAGRVADELDGQRGSGRSASWYRLPDGRRTVTGGDLAVLGDFTMLELHDALGGILSGNSLDNTLRIGTLEATEWVLVDTRVSMVAHGFAAVTAHLWSDTGTLLGVVSQTLVLRRVDPEGRPVRTGKRFAGPVGGTGNDGRSGR